LDIVKSSPYFGSFLGYSIFSYLSNSYGRRPTMILSLGMASLGGLIVSVGYNLIMITIGVVMTGAGISVSASMVFYFLGRL
jgi:MFS family permease